MTNKKIVERDRCLLSSARPPKHYWGEALSSASYLINLSLSYPIAWRCSKQGLLLQGRLVWSPECFWVQDLSSYSSIWKAKSWLKDMAMHISLLWRWLVWLHVLWSNSNKSCKNLWCYAPESILVCVPPRQQQDTNNSNSVPSCSTKQYIEHDDAGNSKMMIAGAGD
jgi:hypothetical protein